jgi:hypothetical protein
MSGNYTKYIAYKIKYLILQESLNVQEGGTKKLDNLVKVVDKNFKNVDLSKTFKELTKKIKNTDNLKSFINNSNNKKIPPELENIINKTIQKDPKLVRALKKTIKDLGGENNVKNQLSEIEQNNLIYKKLINKMMLSKMTGGMFENSTEHMKAIDKQHEAPKKTQLNTDKLFIGGILLIGSLFSLAVAIKCNNKFDRSPSSKKLNILGAIFSSWGYYIYLSFMDQDCYEILRPPIRVRHMKEKA